MKTKKLTLEILPTNQQDVLQATIEGFLYGFTRSNRYAQGNIVWKWEEGEHETYEPENEKRIRIVRVESPPQWKHLPPCEHCGLPVPWHTPICPLGKEVQEQLRRAGVKKG